MASAPRASSASRLPYYIAGAVAAYVLLRRIRSAGR